MNRILKYCLFFGILLVLTCFSLNLGNFHIPPQKILSILIAKIRNVPLPDLGKYEDVVLLSLRLPRIIMVILVGASLGVAGAVSQGIFRNPLVSVNGKYFSRLTRKSFFPVFEKIHDDYFSFPLTL